MFAVLHVPDLPVVAALRFQSRFRDVPCAILAMRTPNEPQEKLPLLALNPLARMSGIRTGWPLNRALVRCPGLTVIPRDPAAEKSLLEELIVTGESLGPDLEVTAADAVTVGLSSRSIPINSLPPTDFEIWHACASTPDLAYLAARHQETRSRMIVPADLTPLPLEILRSLPSRNNPMALLELWGLATLGDFMALPRQALAERLGPEAGRWHDLLHGKTCRLLRLHRPPESFEQSYDFDDPVVSLDPLVFVLKGMLHTLAGRLAARHLAASSLDFRLQLESGDEMARRIRLPEPQTAVEGMLSPLQTLLESLRLDAPVVALHLDAKATFATAAQREWFGRQLPQPERWAETLAKLEALLGPGRVGIPVPANSFKPDGFSVHPAAGVALGICENPSRPDCPLPLHRFRPPPRISVAYETRGRQPWPLALLNGPHPGEIIDRRGPFPASGDWWDPAESWQRLEWDIQLASRHLLRLVFQTPDHWQLDGIYR
jgi:protein ImuB